MSTDELAVMDGGKCILQVQGVRPFFSDKFDITKHPQYKYLLDSSKKNAYTGLNLPHAREKPATSPENFRHLAGEGCQCKRETTYCEEHTKNV